MSWDDQVAQFVATASAVGGLVDTIPDGTQPGLGEWDVHALAAHTLRALTTLEEYLDRLPAEELQLPDAVAYFDAYLDRRKADPDRIDAAVAERGRAAAGESPIDTLGPEFVRHATRLSDRLAAEGPGRLIVSPFGAIQLREYLRTREFELVVHGLDLAAAVAAPSGVPETAVLSALHLLVALAHQRGSGEDLIRMLTGRVDPGPPVMPVVR